MGCRGRTFFGSYILGCLGEEPKTGKERAKVVLGRKRHGKKKKEGGKRDQSPVNKWLISMLVWP